MRKVLIRYRGGHSSAGAGPWPNPKHTEVSRHPGRCRMSPHRQDIATIESCSVTPLTKDGEALVSAQEAGVIVDFGVGELDSVKKGQVMVQIDDAMAQKQFANAKAEFNAAKQKADSDIDIKVAEAAAVTAEYEYKRMLAANQGSDGKGGIAALKGVPGAVTDVDLKHSWYQWEHARLAIDQYKNEKIVNTYTADAKKAEMESAEEAIHRRKVCAPFDGVVQKITPHLGEWVKPGDPVVRLIRMDHLKVEGYLKVVGDYNPGRRDESSSYRKGGAGKRKGSFFSRPDRLCRSGSEKPARVYGPRGCREPPGKRAVAAAPRFTGENGNSIEIACPSQSCGWISRCRDGTNIDRGFLHRTLTPEPGTRKTHRQYHRRLYTEP